MVLIIDKKISEALRQIGGGKQQRELRGPTDLRAAAEVLRKAEEQIGKDEEQRAFGGE
ncbi:MAG TPA: hypothetical protein VJP85_00585 [Candidatus Baltobacteraceae bacterium]|nr:hypothetical protein [Candidatus Baltobacteraceae bacterium]